MNQLKISIEELQCLRTEMHGKLEDRTIERIDEVISALKTLEHDKSRRYDPVEVLNLLGSVIEILPTVGKAIEYLLEVCK
jgi:hypothetical protein